MSQNSFSSAVPLRGFHLDLKGLPPTIDRLSQLISLAALAGYNAVLCEWEDMFPWTVDLRFRASYAYSEKDIQRIHAHARSLNMQVIPLVQCLGHMQTPLSHPQYLELRQTPYLATTLDPLKNGAKELILRMVDDVLAHTPAPAYFHLGGDEADGLGSTPAQQRFIADHGPASLYLHHVEPILDHLLRRGIRPLLWHDMMCDWPADALDRIAPKADLMVWGYSDPPGHPNEQRLQLMRRFTSHGIRLWGACAYKGADDHSADLPNFDARIANAQAYVHAARQFDFAGLIATGWSRYNTHRVQCEPIDGALDSLVTVGSILSNAPIAADPRSQALEILDRAGELSHFNTVHDCLRRLRDSRQAAWTALRQLREQLSLARRHSGVASDCLRQSIRQTRLAQAAAGQLLETLRGQVPAPALEEYIQERLECLHAQNVQLAPLVADQEPQAWAAHRAQLAPAGIDF